MASSVCLVFGGTRGLGAAIVRSFLKNHCNVLIVGRSVEAFDEFRSKLAANIDISNLLGFFEIDLDRSNSPEDVCDHLRNNYTVTSIIHNYGGTVNGRNVSSDLSDWNACLWKNVMFSAKFNALITENVDLGTNLRRIIHISSASARHLLGSQLYATSKALLNAYVKTNGRLLARKGIVQLAVAPGALNTKNGPWESKPDVILRDFLEHYQFCGHLGHEDTIAELVYALNGPAGEFCYGNIIEVDGASI